jgi:hypothetical protein
MVNSAVHLGWGWSSVVEHLTSMHQALGPSPALLGGGRVESATEVPGVLALRCGPHPNHNQSDKNSAIGFKRKEWEHRMAHLWL